MWELYPITHHIWGGGYSKILSSLKNTVYPEDVNSSNYNRLFVCLFVCLSVDKI